MKRFFVVLSLFFLCFGVAGSADALTVLYKFEGRIDHVKGTPDYDEPALGDMVGGWIEFDSQILASDGYYWNDPNKDPVFDVGLSFLLYGWDSMPGLTIKNGEIDDLCGANGINGTYDFDFNERKFEITESSDGETLWSGDIAYIRPVPEAGTAVLLGIGVLFFGGWALVRSNKFSLLME